MDRFSVSKINDYNTCQYKFHLKYNKKIFKIYSDNGPENLGSLVHAGLAAAMYAYYENQYSEDSDLIAKRSAERIIYERAEATRPPQSLQIEGIDLPVNDAWTDQRELAIELVHRTLDYLDVRNNYRTVIIDNQPLVEYQLEYPMPGTDFVLSGYIDWVTLNLNSGLIELWDFKTREKMQDESNDWLNQQTYIYQYVLSQLFGIDCPIIVIGQIRAALPKVPEVTKNGNVSKANITTTWKIYSQALIDNGENPDDPEFDEIRSRLIRSEEFWRINRFVRNDKTMAARMYKNFELTAKQAHDTMYPVRVFGYNCFKCPYKDWCTAEVQGLDPEELIGTIYQELD